MVKIAAGIVVAALLLFFGLAAMKGIGDASRADEIRKADAKLTHVSILLARNLAALRSKRPPRPSAECTEVAASAWRMAEARELGLDADAAVELVLKEPDLYRYLAESGFRAPAVMRGLAASVYARSASPELEYSMRLAECGNGGPGR